MHFDNTSKPMDCNLYSSKGDDISDLHEDMFAEQKVRSTYKNLIFQIK